MHERSGGDEEQVRDAPGGRTGPAGRRVTIKQIAERVGISKGAVSYALNGRPGVSEATRARVLQVAAELDWAPDSAARSLSGARTRTVGLVVARPPEALGAESFFVSFVAGLESVLGPRGHGLLLQVVPAAEAEVATLRAWARERRVDGVVLLDPRVDDPRIPLVAALRLPAVVVGHPGVAAGLPCVWKDDAATVVEVVDHLVRLGHRCIGRVGGPRRLGRTAVRDGALAAAAATHGVHALVRHTDFSGAQAVAATLGLVQERSTTALLYDNDLMAVAGLSALGAAGLGVPGDVAVVAWDDSVLCHVTHPRLTAVGHDLVAYGAAVAESLVRHADGEAVGDVEVPAPDLRVRASSSRVTRAATGPGSGPA